MAFVLLTPLGTVEEKILRFAAEAVSAAFLAEARVGAPRPELTHAFDSVRNQYHVSKLMTDLLAAAPTDAFKVLGVAEVDLFLPIFTFVFGEAQLNGRGAILSTYRLRNEFYGLRADADLLASRVRKEAVHEMGHAFGLTHCLDPVCVMRSSTYVEDVDLKSLEFCYTCRRQLNERLPKPQR
jgi:archaemetzincin